MSRIKIVPTDADYQSALHRFTLLDWAKVKQAAIRCAAERLLEANMAEQKRLCGELTPPGVTMQDHLNWRRKQDRITELFEDHDRLLDIAYPRDKDPDHA